MNGLLLDSLVALWLLNGTELTPRATAAVEDSRTPLYVSLATPWELAIKQGTGKLEVSADYIDLLLEQGVQLLDIDIAHCRALLDLPHHHGDPFDRMLVAQAQVEGLTLVTRDARLAKYDVRTLAA